MCAFKTAKAITKINKTMSTTSLETTQLTDLSDEYSLSDEQISDFRRDGHILLRGLVSPQELATYRPAINSAADRFNSETKPLEERDTYGKAFLQIQNLWEQDEAVRKFVLAQRFAHVAARLLGAEGVRIYHDQALFKEPGGGPTPWHQDQYYWPLDTEKTITMWMPLVNIPAEVGSMTFGSGTQHMGYLGNFKISDESEVFFNQMLKDNDVQLANYGALSAGDATWHYGWTLHGAPGNPTQMMREVITIIYFADGARVSEPEHDEQRKDIDKWMPGLRPGDLAATSLNPLVPGK